MFKVNNKTPDFQKVNNTIWHTSLVYIFNTFHKVQSCSFSLKKGEKKPSL